ncbi:MULTISPECIES: hypothetical protein [Streptomycetaceae]|uniref:Asp23/Gls24 family envelope stress response protein n=1 Tax=Streptantibioticus cattleyicolor (strain ATCC 35852 / DSM 46488 / JCM 4925 / NBRC 14057 / NRRL 8057) TaxID=1003195 RepID=F8K1T1_STREN|nr:MULTISPECIES: hypothetical protein [Streptomycetaceae]AEW92400.1 hypothetical protein SCATT_00290 [Streptantibioticus cattleyicolor NRRL 8057 = DSM 46488]MYS57211.1 hypothetical protein [Streptomyces sp. SID5468]CCB72765.1 conserved protein of unknown function [Streptantibioticus cattleyicolor NRRL 8057 = DSM 46488]
MTGRPAVRAALTATAADTARRVPGVAFLRPAFTGLLRRPAATGDRAAVRAERLTATPPDWRLHVHLAVAHGHRALDVARDVRATVTHAAGTALAEAGQPDATVRVTVTVTNIT